MAKIAPDWPYAMKRATAAAYLDMSETAFIREVERGRLPSPFALGGRDHWLRSSIDAAVARMGGKQMPEWEREFWSNGTVELD